MSLFYFQQAAAQILGSLFKRSAMARPGQNQYSKKQRLSQFLAITLLCCLIGSQLIGLRHAIVHNPLTLGHGSSFNAANPSLTQTDIKAGLTADDDPLLPDSSVGHHCQLLDAATLADLASSLPIIVLLHQVASQVLRAPEHSLLGARLMRLYDGRAPPFLS